jgi:hypothetical protein
MSKLNVNLITNRNEDGPVELSKGAIIPDGQQFTVNGDINLVGVLTATTYNVGSIDVTGIVTASAFYGDGSQLSNLPSVNESKIIAYTVVFGPENNFRS